MCVCVCVSLGFKRLTIMSFKYYLCLYSCLSYPTCKLHIFCDALYRCLWPGVFVSRMFLPHHLIKGIILGGKNILNAKCMFWFPVQLCLKNSF